MLIGHGLTETLTETLTDSQGLPLFVILAGICIGILLSAFFSGIETGIYTVNRLRLELRADRPENRNARILQHLIARKDFLLCVFLIGNNCANALVAGLGERFMLRHVGEQAASFMTALCLTPILFVLSEALPKQLFRSRSETLTYRMAPVLRASSWLLTPFALLVLWPARFVMRLAKDKSGKAFGSEAQALDRVFVAGGENLVGTLRRTALELGQQQQRELRELMIPIDRMQCLAATAGLAELQLKLEAWRHSRFPLMEEGGGFKSYVYYLDPFLKQEGLKQEGLEQDGRVEELGDRLSAFARPLVELRPETTFGEALAHLEEASGKVGVLRDDKARVLGFVMATDLAEALLSLER